MQTTNKTKQSKNKMQSKIRSREQALEGAPQAKRMRNTKPVVTLAPVEIISVDSQEEDCQIVESLVEAPVQEEETKPKELLHFFISAEQQRAKRSRSNGYLETKLPAEIATFILEKNTLQQMKQTEDWISSFKTLSLDKDELSSIGAYVGNDFQHFKNHFEKCEGPFDLKEKEYKAITGFVSAFKKFGPIPKGTKVYKGYGANTVDLNESDLVVGKVIPHKKCISTSWTPAIAGKYTCTPNKNLKERLLIAYTIADDCIEAISHEALPSGAFTEDSEIIIQPFTTLTVTDIEYRDLPYLSSDRIGSYAKPEKFRIVHVQVSKWTQ